MRLVEALEGKRPQKVKLFCDNQGARVTAVNGIRSKRSKHIDIADLYVLQAVEEKLIEVMRADKANAPDSTVIFNLGNNNKLTSDQVSAVFEEVKNQPRIIVVNTAVPRGWRDENNALIAQYAALYRATVVDWAAISAGHPEYFAPDGVHLVPAGVRAYVDAITATL